MGKIRKARAKAKSIDGNNKPKEPEKSKTNTPTLIQILPKDVDLESVKTFKSIKNKFGIQKQIKKTDKLKIKKEILKQKIDIVKEFSNSKKKTKVSNIEVLDKDFNLMNFLETRDSKKFAPDPEEQNLKPTKNKGIQKKQKRRKRMIEDVNLLKQLMTKAKTKYNR